MVKRLNEILLSFDSAADILSLINSLYGMGDKESDFIANIVSTSLSDSGIEKLTKSEYFSENKKDIIDALDYLISKTSAVIADCKYARTLIKKAK